MPRLGLPEGAKLSAPPELFQRLADGEEAMPLSFSDAQLRAIQTAATPLDAFVRSAFLEAIAVYFNNKTEVSDGELGRCLRELQKEFINYPRTNRGGRDRYGGSFHKT
jgi:hypothetical protein